MYYHSTLKGTAEKAQGQPSLGVAPTCLKPQALSLKPARRRAFTLVELLISISVVAILATLSLGVLYTAQDTARGQKTKATVTKLHNIMMQRFESYRTRRVPIDIPARTSPAVAAAMRLTAIRELMRLEMPDRNTDILVPDPPTGYSNCTVFNNVGVSGNTMAVPWPSLNRAYRRRLGTPSDTTHAAAECLYLILNTGNTEDQSPSEVFRDSEIGDKDKDGLLEFHDAWGNPISWIRWPTGLVSELQSGDPVKQHDPFDPRHVQTAAFALYPMIVSAGPDGQNEINNGPGDAYITANPHPGILDPFTSTYKFGDWGDANLDTVNDSLDNIHNHLIGTR